MDTRWQEQYQNHKMSRPTLTFRKIVIYTRTGRPARNYLPSLRFLANRTIWHLQVTWGGLPHLPVQHFVPKYMTAFQRLFPSIKHRSESSSSQEMRGKFLQMSATAPAWEIHRRCMWLTSTKRLFKMSMKPLLDVIYELQWRALYGEYVRPSTFLCVTELRVRFSQN
jgi:hypothetical protein